MGRKNKFDFKNKQFLLKLEGLARDGWEDRQIADYLHYNETWFCELKKKYPELAEALDRGRQPLDVIIENSLAKRCMGMKVKTITKRWMNHPDGTQTDIEIIQETTTEIPPAEGSIQFWLKNRKPEQWNKQPEKIDVTSGGDKMKQVIVINGREIEF